MDKTLSLRAVAHGQNSLLVLNGMVLCKLPTDQVVSMPVHEYIRAGENRIQVLCLEETGVTGHDALVTCDYSVQVFVELQKDRGPCTLVQAQVLFKLENSLRRGQRLRKGCLLDVSVDLPVSFQRWRYLDVLGSLPDDNNQIRLQDFVLGLQDCFRDKKVSSLLPYFSVRNREIATAYGLDHQEVHTSFSAHLEHLCASSVLCDSALDPQLWRFYAAGRSAVYALLNSRYEPLFQFQCAEPAVAFQLPMHVGVLGGEVFVLR